MTSKSIIESYVRKQRIANGLCAKRGCDNLVTKDRTMCDFHLKKQREANKKFKKRHKMRTRESVNRSKNRLLKIKKGECPVCGYKLRLGKSLCIDCLKIQAERQAEYRKRHAKHIDR